VLDGINEYASIANFTSAGRTDNRRHYLFRDFIRNDCFQHRFRQESQTVFRAMIYGLMALLPAVAPYFADRHSRHLDPGQSFFHLFDLLVADDGRDQFHEFSRRGRASQADSINHNRKNMIGGGVSYT
jgi:hypothetical protein